METTGNDGLTTNESGGITTNQGDDKKYVPYINPIYGFKLETLIYSLLKSEPFFAHFLMDCRVIFDHEKIQTAAASVKNGDIFFYFNRNFMATYPVAFQQEIVKHEIFHVLLDHCGKRGGKYGSLNHSLKNIAMDGAINQFLKIKESLAGFKKDPSIPGESFEDGGVSLKSMEEMCKKRLEPFQNWEYYYQVLMESAKQSGRAKYVPMDDHGMMEEGGNEESDGINRGRVAQAAKKAAKSAAGNVSSAVAKILSQLKDSQLPWKQVLRNFVANNRDVKRISTRRRANRRFELDQPGYKKEKKLKIGVCVDESGSVSDAAFEAFMTEIFQIVKNTSLTIVVYADCEVQHVEKIKNGKVEKEKLLHRYGSGGTAYQPAIDVCMKNNVDCIIYMGDMDAADTPSNPGVPFLWVRVGNSEPPAKFGRVVDLNL